MTKPRSVSKKRTKRSKTRKTRSAPSVIQRNSSPMSLTDINKLASRMPSLRLSPYKLRSQMEMENAFRKVQARGRFNNKKHGAGRILGSISGRNTFAKKIGKAIMGSFMATQEVGYRHRGTFQPNSYKPTPHKWVI